MKNLKLFGALGAALCLVLIPDIALAGEGNWYFPKYSSQLFYWIVGIIKVNVFPSDWSGMGIYILSTAVTLFWCLWSKDFRKVPAKFGGGVGPGILVIAAVAPLFLLAGELLVFIFDKIPEDYYLKYFVLALFILSHFVGPIKKWSWSRYPKIIKSAFSMAELGLSIMKGSKSTSSPSTTIAFAVSGAIMWSVIINLQLWNNLIGWPGFTMMVNFAIGGIMIFFIVTGKTRGWLKERPKGPKKEKKPSVKKVKCPHCGKRHLITSAKCPSCSRVNKKCPLNCKDRGCPDVGKAILKPGTKSCPHGCPGPLYRGNMPVTSEKKAAKTATTSGKKKATKATTSGKKKLVTKKVADFDFDNYMDR